MKTSMIFLLMGDGGNIDLVARIKEGVVLP